MGWRRVRNNLTNRVGRDELFCNQKVSKVNLTPLNYFLRLLYLHRKHVRVTVFTRGTGKVSDNHSVGTENLRSGLWILPKRPLTH